MLPDFLRTYLETADIDLNMWFPKEEEVVGKLDYSKL
jgi:hypothetical protein